MNVSSSNSQKSTNLSHGSVPADLLRRRDEHAETRASNAQSDAALSHNEDQLLKKDTDPEEPQEIRRSAKVSGDPSAISEDGRTDEQLLEAYRFQDDSAFAALVNRYQRELFHFLVRFLGDRAAAEDVFQETFLQVHQSAEQFDLQRRFRPWLFTIAANKARDLMRSQARRPTNPLQASLNPGDDDSGQFIDLMESTTQLPSAPMEKRELQGQVQGTVLGMPDHLREILLLSYFHQFPYKQISDILNIPLGTVKSRLHAAVAYFGDRWRATQQNQAAAQ